MLIPNDNYQWVTACAQASDKYPRLDRPFIVSGYLCASDKAHLMRAVRLPEGDAPSGFLPPPGDYTGDVVLAEQGAGVWCVMGSMGEGAEYFFPSEPPPVGAAAVLAQEHTRRQRVEPGFTTLRGHGYKFDAALTAGVPGGGLAHYTPHHANVVIHYPGGRLVAVCPIITGGE